MFFSKTVEIESLISEYSDTVVACFNYYMHAMDTLLKVNATDKRKEFVLGIESLERAADEKRHQIIQELLQGGLIVDSRKSLMRMLEHLYGVCNVCEDILQEIDMQKINLHEILQEPIQSINKISKNQLEVLVQTIAAVVGKYKLEEMILSIRLIENLETQVDTLEHDVVRKIYDMDLELAEKNQLRALIGQIGNIADIVEDVSDEIEIIMMARSV